MVGDIAMQEFDRSRPDRLDQPIDDPAVEPAENTVLLAELGAVGERALMRSPQVVASLDHFHAPAPAKTVRTTGIPDYSTTPSAGRTMGDH
jgi:hypothetical protein